MTIKGVKSVQSAQGEGRTKATPPAPVCRVARMGRPRLLRQANHQRWDSWLVNLDNACTFHPGAHWIGRPHLLRQAERHERDDRVYCSMPGKGE